MFKIRSYYTYRQTRKSHYCRTRLCGSIVSKPSELKLRKWQEGALSACLCAIEKREWGVVSAATGTGKSVVIASICASLQGRILITVPSQYLVNQLSLDLLKMCDPSEIGLYYQREKNISKRITICTLQSLSLLVQEELFEPPSLWIADEVHKTETQIIKQSVLDLIIKQSVCMTAIGFTATPFRADRKEELSLFTHNIFKYGIQDGIKDGVLVPYQIIHYNPKVTSTDVSAQINATSLSIPANQPVVPRVSVDDAAIIMIKDHLKDHPVGPGLVNDITIQGAEEFSDLLCAEGIPAAAIHSKMSKFQQEERIRDLESGKYKALVYVSMLSEGVNLPWLSWICFRRETRSRVRFIQEFGRVLRVSFNKKMAYIFDPLGLTFRFNLSQDAVLQGMSEDSDDEEIETEIDEDFERSRRIEEIHEKYAVAISPNAAYILNLGLRIDPNIGKAGWFYEPCSRKQITYLSNKVKNFELNEHIPKIHMKRLRNILWNKNNYLMGTTSLRKGEMHILISLYPGFDGINKTKEEIEEVFDFDVNAVGYDGNSIL